MIIINYMNCINDVVGLSRRIDANNLREDLMFELIVTRLRVNFMF